MGRDWSANWETNQPMGFDGGDVGGRLRRLPHWRPRGAGVFVPRNSHSWNAVCRERRLAARAILDRKSRRLNSSHVSISYAVFCLKPTSTSDIYTLSLHDALPI